MYTPVLIRLIQAVETFGEGCSGVGGDISPLLANLFMHFVFDKWRYRKIPHLPFEWYADDIICNCRTEEDAPRLWRQIEDRLATLHPKKTKIDYLLSTS